MGDSERVRSDGVVYAISLCGCTRFIEQDQESKAVPFDEFLRSQQTIDFLRSDADDADVPTLELFPSRLQLSQLPTAVRSPRTTQKDHQRRPAVQIGVGNRPSVGRLQLEIRGPIPDAQRLGVVLEHGGYCSADRFRTRCGKNME